MSRRSHTPSTGSSQSIPRKAADPLRYHDEERQAMLPYHEYPEDVIEDSFFYGDVHYKHYDKPEDMYDDEEAMEEFLEPALTQDVYALLYTANLNSPGFWFAFMTFGLQFNLLWLLFFNLYDTDFVDPNTTNDVVNRLRMPAGVEYTVTFAQFLGLVLTVILMANEGDAVQGISQLVEGYEPAIQEKSPNATFFRWLASGAFQTGNGLMFVVLSFILTMQSTDVISLFLNLTGLIFLQEIDDWGFQLASSGLLGTRAQADCYHVMDIKQLVPEDMKKRILYSKRAFVVVLLISVIVPYTILAFQQADGKYLCSVVYVQMGDNIDPQYAYYSGLFERRPWQFLLDYYDRRPNYEDPTNTLELSWCNTEEAWTISFTNTSSCDYIFKSSTSRSFDVLDAEGGEWYVKTARTGDYPVDWIKLLCNDCSKNQDRCNGKCEDNYCVIDEPGWRGLNYEFAPATCDFFSADQTTTASLSAISGASFFLNNIFTPLLPETNVAMNNRLVYTDISVASATNISDAPVRTFLLYSGRRWIIFGLPQGVASTLTYNELVEFLNANDSNQNNVATLRNISTNNLFSAFAPIFFSSPVDYGTDSYSVEPSAVTWLRAEEDASEPILGYRADETNPVDAKLHCAACNDATNPCQNGGRCVDGSCTCPKFFEGFMCEYAIGCVEVDNSCFYNHSCNPFTNICACDPGYYGNLCQFGPDVPEDPFFCESYSCEGGLCNCTFSPRPAPTLAPTVFGSNWTGSNETGTNWTEVVEVVAEIVTNLTGFSPCGNFGACTPCLEFLGQCSWANGNTCVSACPEGQPCVAPNYGGLADIHEICALPEATTTIDTSGNATTSITSAPEATPAPASPCGNFVACTPCLEFLGQCAWAYGTSCVPACPEGKRCVTPSYGGLTNVHEVCALPEAMFGPSNILRDASGIDPSAPTTAVPTTGAPTTGAPTTAAPTTSVPTTAAPTTAVPTTAAPTTAVPTTAAPITAAPITASPTTGAPITASPTSPAPITTAPTRPAPINVSPTIIAPVVSTVAPSAEAPI